VCRKSAFIQSRTERSSAKNSCLASIEIHALRLAGLLSENLANRLGVGDQRVSRELQVFDGAPGSFLVAGATCVSHKNRNVPKIGSVARCRFDSNLSRHADNDKGVDAAISQSEIEPRALESRHR